MRFNWDPIKEQRNIAKHGVDFTKASEAFGDPEARIAFDSVHSSSELRWWLIGRVDGRILLVRYTHRPDGIVRIIGAGYWSKAEKIYAKKKT
ncbi:MAG: BrnT family toxin [Opitutaceae bacterium]|nr:BrnT family toxin [Opitutaceae bacterium]